MNIRVKRKEKDELQSILSLFTLTNKKPNEERLILKFHWIILFFSSLQTKFSILSTTNGWKIDQKGPEVNFLFFFRWTYYDDVDWIKRQITSNFIFNFIQFLVYWVCNSIDFFRFPDSNIIFLVIFFVKNYFYNEFLKNSIIFSIST